jgi:hypothetical protein
MLAALLPGCSLVKLSADVTQGHCASDADCAELNADPKFGDDPCQRWQCNTDEKLCRYGSLDADHDGQSPARVTVGDKAVTCEQDAAKQDCADDDETIGAGFEELCDEQDNDCDGRSDEGALQSSSSRAVVFEAAGGSEGATDAAYARDPMSGAIALGYGVLQDANARPGASLLDPALDDRTSATTLAVEKIGTPIASQVAIAPLDGGRFAYALVNQSGAQRVVAGVWRTAANQVGVLDEIATMGVHCAPDEDCGSDAVTGPSRQALSPALASEGSDVLLAYLLFDSDPASVGCGDLRRAGAPARLLVNLLARPSTDEHLVEQSASALRLGNSSDLAAPALLTLPAIGDVAPSWLVGYADENGAVVVQQLRRDRKQLALVDPALIKIGGAGSPSFVTLALGPVSEDSVTIGIAHQEACGALSQIRFDLWQLSDDGGRLVAENTVPTELVGGFASSSESNPALTYSSARNVWLVAYHEMSGLRARVLDTDGAPYGERAYTLIESFLPEGHGNTVDILPVRMAAFDLGSDFAIIAHVLREAESDPRAFEVTKLGCKLK